ncbi:hypothetical protein K438DRAFT_1972415 [Mycena galopus ATCC 62051]|nr:hypothetical protein K438DRAFT_1972415 [Mycena galopus ATCC 62051]
MAAATNLILVAFTAGRIWIKQREAVYVDTDNTLKNHYNTVIATIVESGVLYCLFAILLAIQKATSNDEIAFVVIYSLRRN